MLFNANHERSIGALREHLRRAPAITPELVSDVIAEARERFQSCHPAAKASVEQLILSGAWVDAIFALLELELPQWKLRRLAYDDGEWYCSLSRQRGLPAELDEMAEAVHENLPLAILSALVEARHASRTAGDARPRSVPQVRSAQGHPVCCDNFA
jgi:hypothetical protein